MWSFGINFTYIFVLCILYNYYSMGNQNRKTEKVANYFHGQIEILKWRANVEHNTHIARTFIVNHHPEGSTNFLKVITTQLSNRPYIDLTNLQELSSQHEKSVLQQILLFEKYQCSLVEMEDSLFMEENIYVLTALLFGYENIYKKIDSACVHEKCCFVTYSGEVRAWIHTDPTCCQSDYKFIENEERAKIIKGSDGQKIVCNTQASICTSIISLTLRLSNKGQDFMQFYRQMNFFIKKNILQNLNFIAIRTFINGFIYNHRLVIKDNIITALQRAQSQRQILKCNQNRSNSQKQIEKLKQSFSQLSFSLKSHKIQTPIQEQNTFSNQQRRVDSHKIGHHTSISNLQLRPSFVKCANKSIQTSQMPIKEIDHKCYSTQLQTPRKSSYSSNSHPLIHSDIIFDKEAEKFHGNIANFEYKIITINKQKEPSKFCKNINLDQRQRSCSSNSLIIQANQKNNRKKIVKFHSLQPSFDNADSYYAQPTIEQKQMDFSTHYYFNNSHYDRGCKESNHCQNSNEDMKSEFSNSRSISRGQFQSRALTRVVSGLVSNKELDICQSVGTFQSIENSQISDYSGVLLAMGRSVKYINQNGRRRMSKERDFFSTTQNMKPHTTF